MKWINPNKVISAEIKEPTEREESSLGNIAEKGWSVLLHVGYRDGYPDYINVDKENKEKCIEFIESIKLVPTN